MEPPMRTYTFMAVAALAAALISGCKDGVPPDVEQGTTALASEGTSSTASFIRKIGGVCSTSGAFCRTTSDCATGQTCTDAGQRLRSATVPSTTACNGTSTANGPCCINVAGYYEHGDGGGGTFCYDANSTATEDLGLVVKPNSNPAKGRWIRQVHSDWEVLWFGARCDGNEINKNVDTVAFRQAVKSAHRTGGTLLLPAGRACILRQLDLGQAEPNPPAPYLPMAMGLTFRGASATNPAAPDGGVAGTSSFPSSTIVLQPDDPTVQTGAIICDWQTTAPAGPNGGGITMGPNTNHITFENLELRAGSKLNNCIVNISTTSAFGDPYRINFRRVHFVGNGTTKASVFLRRSSWLTFDQCHFGGSQYAIKEDFNPEVPNGPANSYSTAPEIINNLFYRANQAVKNTVPMVELWDVGGGRIAGNKFENGPNGIYIGQLAGGAIANNWFNGEGETSAAGAPDVWVNVGCSGCNVDANYFIGGADGISVRSAGGRVSNNFFIGVQGTPVTVGAHAVRVEGNYFFGGTTATTDQIDIWVKTGVGHQLGTNFFSTTSNALTNRSIVLEANTRGSLYYDVGLDTTTSKMLDNSKLWHRTSTGDPAAAAASGVVLKSPDGTTCRKLTIDNDGALNMSPTACP
jgi:hypothetical protein